MNRKLNAFEHVLWMIDQIVNQNFVVVARLSGPLTEPLLHQALVIVQHRHPVLKSRIAPGEVPEFTAVAVPPIPLRIIRQTGENHWIQEAEKEMQQPFDWAAGPPVRVVQLVSPDKCHLLLTFCHITADATAGIKFLAHLLEAADKLYRGEDADAVTRHYPTLPVRPAAAAFIRENLQHKLHTGTDSHPGGHSPDNAVELPADTEVPVGQRTSRVIQRTLSGAETKKLIYQSRKEKASVHSALCAAILQTVTAQIRGLLKLKHSFPLTIGCCTAVNIRHRLSEPIGDDIGNFSSDVLHYQPINHLSSLWDAAREVKNSLQGALNAYHDIKGMQKLADLLQTHLETNDMVALLHRLFPPVLVSNMGQLDISEGFGTFTLEALHFTLAINFGAKNGFGLAISNFRGTTTLNFHYVEPYISKVRAHQMVDQVMERLKRALDNNAKPIKGVDVGQVIRQLDEKEFAF